MWKGNLSYSLLFTFPQLRSNGTVLFPLILLCCWVSCSRMYVSAALGFRDCTQTFGVLCADDPSLFPHWETEEWLPSCQGSSCHCSVFVLGSTTSVPGSGCGPFNCSFPWILLLILSVLGREPEGGVCWGDGSPMLLLSQVCGGDPFSVCKYCVCACVVIVSGS